jgi:metal iron transporter
MPHTLYLGSGLVQARMRNFDRKNETYYEARASDSRFSIMLYQPSISAIRSCMAYSVAELCVTLFVVGVFVNSAILIVAASSLSEEAGDADLFGIHRIFVSSVGQASGTIFVLGLLFSGISAGIVATMAGQLVCEGAMNWRMSPFLRRLLTRSIAIIPGVIIAAIEGRSGLATALNRCDVVRSVTLVFLTFPLVWYTSMNKYMRVRLDDREEGPIAEAVDGALGHDFKTVARELEQDTSRSVSLANNWATTTGAWITWFIIASINVVTLVFLGLGRGDDS